jgi:hypothetical protein
MKRFNSILFSILFLVVFQVKAQNVGINSNGSTPQISAGLDVDFSNKGFLPPRLADTNAVLNPAEGLQIYDLSAHCMRYRTNVKWTSCPSDVAPTPPPVNSILGCNPTQTEADYGQFTMPAGAGGLTWITRNLGSTTSPTAKDDISITAAGCYWQFNRLQAFGVNGTAEATNSNPLTTIYAIDELFSWQAENDPCKQQLGTSWRIPTLSEWQNMDAFYLLTNGDDAFAGPLKIHYSGILDYGGDPAVNPNNSGGQLFARGITANNWSSTPKFNNFGGSDFGYSFSVDDNFAEVDYAQSYKALGMTLRCVK